MYLGCSGWTIPQLQNEGKLGNWFILEQGEGCVFRYRDAYAMETIDRPHRCPIRFRAWSAQAIRPFLSAPRQFNITVIACSPVSR